MGRKRNTPLVESVSTVAGISMFIIAATWQLR